MNKKFRETMSDDSWSLISHNQACSSIEGSYAVVDGDYGELCNPPDSYEVIDGNFGVSNFDFEGIPDPTSQTQPGSQPNKISPMVLRRPDWWYYGKKSSRKKQSILEFSFQELVLIFNEILQMYESKFELLETLRSSVPFETSLGVVDVSQYGSLKTKLHETCLKQIFPPISGRILWENYPKQGKLSLLEEETNVEIIREILSIPAYLETRFIAQINRSEHWDLLHSAPYKLIFMLGEETFGHGPDEWECPMCTFINPKRRDECRVCFVGRRFYAEMME